MFELRLIAYDSSITKPTDYSIVNILQYLHILFGTYKTTVIPLNVASNSKANYAW